MISWLKFIGGVRYVIADPELAMGDKWREIAESTKRLYDDPTDLLPLVLRRKRAKFVLDSRSDPSGETDEDLCKEFGIISQYAMPLATESMRIGTLQVDMGSLDREPKSECEMLDAFAAHLSIAIERHRMLERLETVHSELTSQGQIVAFEAAAAKILHELNHSIGDYSKLLTERMRDNEIRTNKAALEFLNLTRKRIAGWIDSVQENIEKVRDNEEVGEYKVEEIVKETIGMWRHKAGIHHRRLEGKYNGPGALVKIRLGALKELLSCLIINAMEANARQIDVIAGRVTKGEKNGKRRYFAQIVVSDDGDGIPKEYREKIGAFGWSSKGRRGHGMGMTIVELLAKSMDGQCYLGSCGRSAGEERTEFVVLIPAKSV
jgi:signal transduction histidine kinase